MEPFSSKAHTTSCYGRVAQYLRKNDAVEMDDTIVLLGMGAHDKIFHAILCRRDAILFDPLGHDNQIYNNRYHMNVTAGVIPIPLDVKARVSVEDFGYLCLQTYPEIAEVTSLDKISLG